MELKHRWHKEAGARLESSRPLDRDKVQAPCIVRKPSGGFRLFYTAVGPAKPFPACHGYILSAVSDDGLTFEKEPGIRLAPRPSLPYMSLRVLAPSICRLGDGRWRMYFESRGPADQPTAICSAVSSDVLSWKLEDGIRLRSNSSIGAPRFLPLTDGRARLYCVSHKRDPHSGEKISASVVSALTSDGLNFAWEQGCRMRDRQADDDSAGITAAEVIPPQKAGGKWTMLYSAWQDVPPGTAVPLHPSDDVNAAKNGYGVDFATASIAVDMAGYRSQIFMACLDDGLLWQPGACVIEGGGHEAEEHDAVHAEDMSVIKLDNETYRMYYAACDKDGTWRIVSAVGSGIGPRLQEAA